MRRSSAKRPPKTSTKLSVSGVLLVCPLVLFGVVFILALVVQFLNSRSDQFITQFRASLSRSRTAEAYHRLGITCEPNDCDNERISCNSSRLMAEELESAVPLIDLISRMRRDNQFLSTNSVRFAFVSNALLINSPSDDGKGLSTKLHELFKLSDKAALSSSRACSTGSSIISDMGTRYRTLWGLLNETRQNESPPNEFVRTRRDVLDSLRTRLAGWLDEIRDVRLQVLEALRMGDQVGPGILGNEWTGGEHRGTIMSAFFDSFRNTFISVYSGPWWEPYILKPTLKATAAMLLENTKIMKKCMLAVSQLEILLRTLDHTVSRLLDNVENVKTRKVKLDTPDCFSHSSLRIHKYIEKITKSYIG